MPKPRRFGPFRHEHDNSAAHLLTQLARDEVKDQADQVVWRKNPRECGGVEMLEPRNRRAEIDVQEFVVPVVGRECIDFERAMIPVNVGEEFLAQTSVAMPITNVDIEAQPGEGIGGNV